MVRRPYKGEFDPDYVIKRLKKLAKRLGRFPKYKELKEDRSLPHYYTIFKYLGSRQKVIEMIGYPVMWYHRSADELLELLKLKIDELGRIPHIEEITEDPKMPHYQTYCKRFGSLTNALKLLGYEVHERKTYTLEDFKGAIKRFYRKYHRSPTQKDFRRMKEFPSPYGLHKLGKTWNQMLMELGLPTYPPKYSLDDFKKLIKAFYRKYGRPPTTREFRGENKLPSSTYVKNFGITWNQLLAQCGLLIHCGKDGNLSINRKAEIFVKKKLTYIGHKVLDLTEQTRKSPYSLLVDNKIRLHITGSGQQSYGRTRRKIWSFCIPEKRKFDYIVGVGIDKSGKPKDIFVFPIRKITTRIINIPIYGRSKYFRYRVPSLREVFPLRKRRRKRLKI